MYDGECGVCTRCARWVAARAKAVDVVPWQSLDLAAAGLTEHQVRTAAYWLEGGTAYGGELAVARALISCGPPYAGVGGLVLLPGVRSLAAPIYRVVARHRSWLSLLLPRR